MGSFRGHMLPGTLFLLVGLWRVWSSVARYAGGDPASFRVRAWNPAPPPLRLLELYVVAGGAFIDMCVNPPPHPRRRRRRQPRPPQRPRARRHAPHVLPLRRPRPPLPPLPQVILLHSSYILPPPSFPSFYNVNAIHMIKIPFFPLSLSIKKKCNFFFSRLQKRNFFFSASQPDQPKDAPFFIFSLKRCHVMLVAIARIRISRRREKRRGEWSSWSWMAWCKDSSLRQVVSLTIRASASGFWNGPHVRGSEGLAALLHVVSRSPELLQLG